MTCDCFFNYFTILYFISKFWAFLLGYQTLFTFTPEAETYLDEDCKIETIIWRQIQCDDLIGLWPWKRMPFYKHHHWQMSKLFLIKTLSHPTFKFHENVYDRGTLTIWEVSSNSKSNVKRGDCQYRLDEVRSELVANLHKMEIVNCCCDWNVKLFFLQKPPREDSENVIIRY